MARKLKFYWTGRAGEIRNWVNPDTLSGNSFWNSVQSLEGKNVRLTLEEIPKKKLKKVI